ncbi:MAG: T9SS type A sorting domain-containing protein, partial [Bacteroidota bacterium]
LVGTGNTFTTPVLTSSTTYWVDESTVYLGPTAYTGITSHSGTSLFSGNTTNAALNFTVINPCTLVSAKVYTDTPGNREIQIRNSGNNVIQSLLVNVPIDSSRITLNFPLTPGTYSITTNSTVNNTNFGFNSPRLRRNSSGVSYPYTINDLVSITGSNQGSGFYYYLYDWEVKGEDVTCVSARVPALAEITLTGVSETASNSFSVYPNPASDYVMINAAGKTITLVELTDLTGRLVRSLQFPKGNTSDIRLNLEGLASGQYQLMLTHADRKTSAGKVTVK